MVTKLCGFVMSASLLMNQAVYASGELAGETLSGEVQSAEVQEEIMNSANLHWRYAACCGQICLRAG